MAIEYKDGTWGDIKPLNEAISELQNIERLWEVKALHVGTVDELRKRKDETATEIRLKEMEARIKKLEKNGGSLLSEFLHIPTKEEVDILTKPE